MENLPARQKRRTRATEMEEEQNSRTLPEPLVEKIVAMMPFPSIFKAKSLSKSWLTRFSPVSSLQDGPERCLAASFQKEVGEWSKRWESFSPLCLGMDDFVAYNQAAQNWQRLPSLSFLPHTSLLRSIPWQLQGPLLVGFVLQDRSHSVETVIAANILTRSWRQLPDRPNAHVTPALCHTVAIYPTLGAYKDILFCGQANLPDDYCVQVYDSKSNAWSSKKFVVSRGFTDRPSVAAYLNGVVYVVGLTTPQSLLAFNVEEGTLAEIRLTFDGSPLRTATMNLVVCNAKDLLVATKGLRVGDIFIDTVQVLRVDLKSLRLVWLALGPPPALGIVSIPFLAPVGDGSCVFFKEEEGPCQVVEYNVDKNAWHCFPVPVSVRDRSYSWRGISAWIGNAFQPGLCPFVVV